MFSFTLYGNFLHYEKFGFNPKQSVTTIQTNSAALNTTTVQLGSGMARDVTNYTRHRSHGLHAVLGRPNAVGLALKCQNVLTNSQIS